MKILSGWKQIASHMQQGVPTVQRWELVGLPVHRPKAGPRSQVIAFEEELDAWAEAAPMRVFSSMTELRAKVEKVEEQLRNLKHPVKGGAYKQSSGKAHKRGELARAFSARHSRDLLRMREAAGDASETSKKRHQNRATLHGSPR